MYKRRIISKVRITAAIGWLFLIMALWHDLYIRPRNIAEFKEQMKQLHHENDSLNAHIRKLGYVCDSLEATSVDIRTLLDEAIARIGGKLPLLIEKADESSLFWVLIGSFENKAVADEHAKEPRQSTNL